jgi:hypothetical protein
MTTLLTWEPRRARVLLAKVLAAMLATAVLSLATLTALGLAMLPAAVAHGAPAVAGDPRAGSVIALVLRGTALCTLAGGMGFAIATIGRGTSAALGVGFGYVVVLENILGSSIAGWRRWLLLGNAIVLVAGDASAADVPGRSAAGAGLFLVAVTVALVTLAVGALSTRDVT